MRASAAPPRRVWLAVLVGLCAAGTIAGVASLAADDEQAGPSAVAPARTGPFMGNVLPEGIAGRKAPAFNLLDVRAGRPLSSAQLRGKPYVLTLLYTDCKDVCPLIGRELRQTLELIGDDARRVAVVAVSVDPERDTPAAVRRWLRLQRQPESFHYLIGRRRTLAPLWKAYFAAPQPEGEERSRHTASVWLIDARGRWRTKYSGGAPFKPRDVAHDLWQLLREG